MKTMQAGQRLRIALVDDHRLFREGVARLLEREPDFEVVVDTATVAEARRTLAAHPADILLLDYDLGDEVGTDLLVGAEALGGDTKTILVTAGMRQGATLHALAAGVHGIVMKHSDPGLLIEAIRTVAGGRRWLDPATMELLPTRADAGAGAGGTAKSVTARQRQVLRSILDGLSNKEIAARIQGSESAVKATIQELFSKAGVRTRSQLVRVAIERYSLEWLREEDR